MTIFFYYKFIQVNVIEAVDDFGIARLGAK